jgi:hypothetical protein
MTAAAYSRSPRRGTSRGSQLPLRGGVLLWRRPCQRNRDFLGTFGGCVDVDSVDTRLNRASPAGRPHHRQDTRPDYFGQRGPGVDERSQKRVDRAGLGGECAGICAALGGKCLILQGSRVGFDSHTLPLRSPAPRASVNASHFFNTAFKKPNISWVGLSSASPRSLLIVVWFLLSAG